MNVILGLLMLAAIAPQRVDVFVSGQEGFHTFRIPSVIVTKGGAVLAFAEGRRSREDQSENKIVLKRSADNGTTWSSIQVIADAGQGSLNNPCAVVEQTSGQVFLMYQSYPPGQREGNVRCWVTSSNNDGKTWSPPQDVTSSCKAPAETAAVASGPGIGIQLVNGSRAGRLIMPFNEGPRGMKNVYAVFSDDQGKTWQTGKRAPGAHVVNSKGNTTSLVAEVQMVELSDGAVMLNSRSWGGRRLRKTAVSRDAGVTWSPVGEDEHLRDPRCMASVLRYSFDKNILLYSGPDSSDRRNGAVRASHDDGKTWPVKKVLEPGKFAYSCLTRLPDGQIGCLYETGATDAYERLVFAIVSIEWLAAP
ncbi:MAG: exo-alpha-sialidase [Verrucomicrobia bacterium]|nr:exo-alpha-sialidase [Verrucomicrobiota bacterium]